MNRRTTNKPGVLKKLFFSTFYLSAFTFGGGYVIITLLKQKFVDELHWISEEEMLDLVALAQSSPGPIAVNGAILVGYKLAGLPGVLMSVLGAVIPPFVILTLISAFYAAFKSNVIIKTLLTGMKTGVAAVIMSVVFDMMTGVTKSKDPALMIVMIAAFLANFIFHINVVFIILLSAAFGTVRTVLIQKNADRN
jgi:chromate transporter